MAEVGVQDDLARAVAPVAQAEDGEVYAGGLHLRPVDIALVAGDVDADGGGVEVALVVHVAVLVQLEEGGVVVSQGDVVGDVHFMTLVVEILAGGGLGIVVIRVDGAGVVGDVRGVVRLVGGLLLVLLKFVYPADDRADLGAGDVPLGVEVGFAVAFCGALEDAMVGEDEGGHVAGVGEGGGGLLLPLHTQDIYDELRDLQAVHGVVQAQAPAAVEKAFFLGQLVVAAGPVFAAGGGGGVPSGVEDELQGLAQGHGVLGGEGRGGGAGDQLVVVHGLDIGVEPIRFLHVGKGHRPGCRCRDGQGEQQDKREEKGTHSLFHGEHTSLFL